MYWALICWWIVNKHFDSFSNVFVWSSWDVFECPIINAGGRLSVYPLWLFLDKVFVCVFAYSIDASEILEADDKILFYFCGKSFSTSCGDVRHSLKFQTKFWFNHHMIKAVASKIRRNFNLIMEQNDQLHARLEIINILSSSAFPTLTWYEINYQLS